MTAFLNSLPSRSLDDQIRHKQVGLGLSFSTSLLNTPEKAAWVTLETTSDNAPEDKFIEQSNREAVLASERFISLQTKHGTLFIESSQAEPFLNALSTAPFTLVLPNPKSMESHRWYTELYLQGVDPIFLNMFGAIQQSTDASDSSVNRDQAKSVNAYSLCWNIGSSSGLARVYFNDQFLNKLLHTGGWKPTKVNNLNPLKFEAPVTLGFLTVPYSQFCALQHGDILLPDESIFDVSGVGSLHFSTHTIAVSAIPNGTNPSFQVTHICKGAEKRKSAPFNDTKMRMHEMYDESHESATDETFDTNSTNIEHHFSDDTLNPDSADTLNEANHISESNHDLPSYQHTSQTYPDTQVTLTLNAGTISTTFEELSQLDVGSLLVATGERAGYATLYHNQQAVARGELINVEGRLGVQLTQVFLETQPFHTSTYRATDTHSTQSQ
ncbi:FliM/FliN family flagellar motor switch protein [Marinomonas balearica]|uniref:Type III flagellar switch regulator (C-ring) FliN n=1 Tax=Marinomonas balearica TaxID=491947 RepID=A0A4R6MAF7_9GAMM|nr:FliM/FliN family flagellar motor switch protein [Marinomonas balearica]TDO98246.1 type III flagellar switch regulator (C-ring) FliN [Marinomonas balearica]